MRQTVYSTRTRELLIVTIIFLTTFLIYLRTIEYSYNFDDRYIFDNPHIYRVENFHNLIKDNRPLSKVLSLAIAISLKLHPAAFHAAAIFLHLSCGLLLYCLIKDIMQAAGHTVKDPIAPYFITSVFLLHPLQTESAAYIFQSLTVLPMALFTFISGICYINYRLEKKSIYTIFLLLSQALAASARESAVVIPFFLWLIEWLVIQRGEIKRSFLLWPVFLSNLFTAAAIIKICSSFADYGKAGMGPGSIGMTSASYLVTQFAVISRYIFLVFIPVGQNLDYDFPHYTTLFSPAPLFAFVLLATIAYTALSNYKERPLFTFGVLWFFLFLAPTSSFIPIIDVIFEHRLYLPLAGAAVAVSSFFLYRSDNAILNRYTDMPIAFCLLCLILLTSKRLDIWKNSYTLWSDAVKKSPKKARPLNNLGHALAEMDNAYKAVEYYRLSLKNEPTYTEAHNNLGFLLNKMGKTKEAIEHFKEAIRLDPAHTKAVNNLGVLFLEHNRLDDALTVFTKALSYIKDNPDIYINIGLAYYLKGEDEMALSRYEKALTIRPDLPDAHNNIALIYARKRMFKKAINHHLEALKIMPYDEKAEYKVGELYFEIKRYKSALKHFKRALLINPAFKAAKRGYKRSLDMINKAQNTFTP